MLRSAFAILDLRLRSVMYEVSTQYFSALIREMGGAEAAAAAAAYRRRCSRSELIITFHPAVGEAVVVGPLAVDGAEVVVALREGEGKGNNAVNKLNRKEEAGDEGGA